MLLRIYWKMNLCDSVSVSAGGVVVTTPVSTAGGTGSLPGTGSCDVKIWLSTLGTVYPS